MRTAEQIWALVRVQVRTLLNTMRYKQGWGGLKVSIAIASLWYGFWIFAAVGAAMLPRFVGAEDIETVLPGVLLFIMAYWQLTPLLTLSLGVSLDARKLAIYPVSIATLFAVECLLRLGTGIEMILLLAGFLGGLAAAGSPHVAELAVAFGLFSAFNIFLSAGVRNLLERLFHQRRLREVLLLLLACATLLPQLLIWSETMREAAQKVLLALQAFPVWVLPSDLAARISVGEGNWGHFVVLTGMVVTAAGFGFAQFRQGYRAMTIRSVNSLRYPWKNGRPRLSEWAARLPSRLLRDPVGALVEKELRYLWRSPRFRLPFFMGFTFGVIAWIPIMQQWETLGEWMEQSAVSLISLYSFLLLGPVMFLNRFGFDRGATRSYFWLPVSLRQLLLAKNLATVVFAAMEVTLIALVCWLVGVEIGWVQIVETVAMAAIALLYLLSVGNFMSIRFPVASNPDRISRAGPGHGVRATVQFLLFPLALAPLLAGFVLRRQFDSNYLFSAWVAAVGVAGLGVYLYTLAWLSSSGEAGREEFVASLSEGEGPIASE
jgi:ABC-2 type transport system permease protein